MKPMKNRRRLHRAERAEAGERQPDRAAADGVHYAESFRQEGHRRYPVECPRRAAPRRRRWCGVPLV